MATETAMAMAINNTEAKLAALNGEHNINK
jgi:hypothetical protein